MPNNFTQSIENDDEPEVLEQVGDILCLAGLPTIVESFLACLYVERKGVQYIFGSANETWGGNVLLDDGDCGEPVATDCPSSERNPATIANAILATLARR